MNPCCFARGHRFLLHLTDPVHDGVADLSDLHVDPPEVDVVGADSPSRRNSTKLIKTSLLRSGPNSQVSDPSPDPGPLDLSDYPTGC